MPGRKNKPLHVKIVTVVILVSVFFLPVDGKIVSSSLSSVWYTHFISQFFHVSIFHLLANLYVLCIIRFSLSELFTAYLLSIPATWMSPDGCIGFSSVLYALMGILIQRIRMGRTEWALFIASNAATAFIPNIAFGVHLSSFSLGWVYARLKGLFHEYGRACKRKQ